MADSGIPRSARSRTGEFSRDVSRVLQDRAANLCSSPLCRRLTAVPHSEMARAIRLGEAAHICAASPGGPRFDPAMPDHVRNSAENGLWLCRQCHALVDRDPEVYTAVTLAQWRREHDAWVSEKAGIAVAAPELTPWECPNCGEGFAQYQRICKGCRSPIYWTTTTGEEAVGRHVGAACGVLLAFAIFVLLPFVLGQLLHRALPFGFGLGIWVAVVVFVFGLVGMIFTPSRLRRRIERNGPRVRLPPGY